MLTDLRICSLGFLRLGQPCVVTLNWQAFFRAVIVSEDCVESVEVLLVDFGSTRFVERSAIFVMDRAFMGPPMQVMFLYLLPVVKFL